MLKLKKTAVMLLSAITLFSTAFAADVTVMTDGIGNSRYMSFENAQPIMENDILFVPARSFADAADMEVEWDQSTETALLSVNLKNESDSPVHKYCSEVINKVSNYGLDITPKKVSAAFTADKYEAVLRFVFEDCDGDEVAVGKAVDMGSAPKVINDSTLMLPLRAACDVFGFLVGWNQEELAVSLSVPNVAVVPVGMKIIPVHTSVETEPDYVYEEAVEADAPVQENKGTYLGRFKITHYCPCSICNGGWGNNTAYAGKITPGQTIAVDPNVIAPMSWVYIDGYGLRRAEDCGGGIKGNHIDMAVNSHSEAYKIGVVYKDVWLQN